MARPKGSKNNPHRSLLPFKQSEVQRAIRGAQAEGFSLRRIDIDPRSGRISLIPAQDNDDGKIAIKPEA